MNVRTIAVIGSGIMWRGIAHVAAAGGFDTFMHDVSTELLERARTGIHKDLKKGVELGKVTADDMNQTLERLKLETDLERAGENADVVIEAVPERIDLK